MTYRLTDLSGALSPLEFAASAAVIAADGTLFIATVPEAIDGRLIDGVAIEFGQTNIFEIDPITAVAVKLATAVIGINWPFAATDRYVAWTDNFCALDDPASRHTRIYDRRAGTLTELDDGFWLELTLDSKIGRGGFGPQALIDLETLAYVAVLPPGSIDVSWTTDYRYGAQGRVFGHGGHCGP